MGWSWKVGWRKPSRKKGGPKRKSMPVVSYTRICRRCDETFSATAGTHEGAVAKADAAYDGHYVEAHAVRELSNTFRLRWEL